MINIIRILTFDMFHVKLNDVTILFINLQIVHIFKGIFSSKEYIQKKQKH